MRAGYGPRRTSAARPDPFHPAAPAGPTRIVGDEHRPWPETGAAAPPVVPGPPLTIDAARAASELMIGALHFSTDVSILVFDPDLRYLAASGTVLERAGMHREAIIGARAPDVLSPEAWRSLAAGYEAALGGGSLSITFPSSDGVTTWETTFSPIVTDGEVTGGMVVGRDVTARRKAGVLLEEITDVFDLTFAHSPVCQALLAPDGRWAKVNAALCTLLGRDEAELLDTTADAVTHPDDRVREAALLRDLAAGGDHYDARKRFLRGDGSAVAAEVRVAPVRAHDGLVRGFVMQVTAVRRP